MSEVIAGITIPDTVMVREATTLVRDATDENLYNHSRRAFPWGSLKAAARGIEADPELAYFGGMFHDPRPHTEIGTSGSKSMAPTWPSAFFWTTGVPERTAEQV
ncbi:hypothetical protein [Amycolatopsis sp. FDAARGOS 1241]|uniref:hypothetical protein n=1 Tax=Amycolatopsis sp. FDAARGOS 1241 TaxID=2778070 RepID=UPI001EF248F9|nr:hypothetical protein [Amycolatopsis sp. FDAARGOS 1241]